MVQVTLMVLLSLPLLVTIVTEGDSACQLIVDARGISND